MKLHLNLQKKSAYRYRHSMPLPYNVTEDSSNTNTADGKATRVFELLIINQLQHKMMIFINVTKHTTTHRGQLMQ